MAECEVLVQGPLDACWQNICYSEMVEPRTADSVEPSCLGGTSIAWFRHYDGGAE